MDVASLEPDMPRSRNRSHSTCDFLCQLERQLHHRPVRNGGGPIIVQKKVIAEARFDIEAPAPLFTRNYRWTPHASIRISWFSVG
jgi:hypothetical protein